MEIEREELCFRRLVQHVPQDRETAIDLGIGDDQGREETHDIRSGGKDEKPVRDAELLHLVG